SDYENAACYNGQTEELGCNIPTDTPGRFVQDLTGSRLANAPLWTVMGGFSWNHPLGNGLELGVDADFKWVDDYRLNVTASPRAVQDSFVKTNARIRLSAADGRWEAALIGRNLTNEYVAIGATA